MPICFYQCVDCHQQESRVAGLDDQIALCTLCGGLMLCRDDPLFAPYFDSLDEVGDALPTFRRGLKLARQPLDGKP